MYDSNNNSENRNELTLSEILEKNKIDSEKEIAEQFKEIVSRLPEELVQWDKWFTPVYLNTAWRTYYQDEVSVKNAHEISEELINYALTPLSFMSSVYGLKLLFKKLVRIDNQERESETETVNFQLNEKNHVLPIELLTSFIDNTVPTENKKAMVLWILKALEVEPQLIPEYEIHKQENIFVVNQIPIKEEHKIEAAVKIEGIKIEAKEPDYVNHYPYNVLGKPKSKKYRDTAWYKAKEELMIQIYGIGFTLYFILTILVLPFEILYSYTRYVIGKWWWKIKGKKNNYDWDH